MLQSLKLYSDVCQSRPSKTEIKKLMFMKKHVSPCDHLTSFNNLRRKKHDFLNAQNSATILISFQLGGKNDI